VTGTRWQVRGHCPLSVARCPLRPRRGVILSEAENLRSLVGYSNCCDSSLRSHENDVIPAKAGIQWLPDWRWTPAGAGVTSD